MSRQICFEIPSVVVYQILLHVSSSVENSQSWVVCNLRGIIISSRQVFITISIHRIIASGVTSWGTQIIDWVDIICNPIIGLQIEQVNLVCEFVFSIFVFENLRQAHGCFSQVSLTNFYLCFKPRFDEWTFRLHINHTVKGIWPIKCRTRTLHDVHF